jgi:asparagine synthase (glutamine-hydrolysing)
MTDQIVHRGPDDVGIFDGGEAIIGMRRLSIIDVDGGQQPISNESGSAWVVNNGEIYNYRELRRDLIGKGYQFRTDSDTEVIIHLYQEFGDSFLEHLEGMFALALWDASKKKLFLARDRLGIKPLYIWRFSGGLAFGSEVKAFLALPSFEARMSPTSLATYVGIGYSIAPECIFSDVEKLAPGSCLIWTDEGVSTVQYWSISDEVDERLGYDEWVESIGAQLRKSVASHLVSDVPVGAFLSGGVDSSCITALMHSITGETVNTYSIGYRGDSVADYYNELPFAKVVAESIGANHHEISVEPNVATLLPKLIWHLEEPVSDSAISTTFLVSELAAESVKVILSGIGGDELFAGYTRHLGGYYDRKYSRLPAWCRERLMPALSRVLPSGRHNAFLDKSRLAKRFIQAGQLDPDLRYAYYMAITDETVASDLLGPQGSAAHSALNAVAREESCSDELLRLLRIDWRSQLAENLLLLTDKLTMACSLECRVPFLDHRLVELAARIPARHKLPKGRLKAVLKDAVAPYVPETVINRGKRGFGAPMGAWFQKDLGAVIDRLLRPEMLEARGVFDPQCVSRIKEEHNRNRQDYTDLILVLLNVEIWARLFVDGESYQDLGDELAECTA